MRKKLKWLGLALALTACLVAGYILGAQLFLKEPEIQASAVQTVDPVEQFRTERQQIRQMQISQLNDMIYGGGAEDALVAMAQERLLSLMECAEQETTLEGVLRMRDFEDAVVTVHDDSVSVLVRTESLNQQQTAVILELVLRETGISGGNVKIIPIN